MATIDPVGQSLYFAATAAASQQIARQSQKKEKNLRTNRASFSSILKKTQEEATLVSEGLPPEIAGMDEESALVFLKDAVDVAGDTLKTNQGLAALEVYRNKISQFMRYIVRNNFEILSHKRRGFTRKGKPFDPQIQIQIINTKLDRLTSDMLYNHADNLKLLASVEEINGMIIDLLAA